ncbi:hypothetical protein D7D52_22080 [Nocardia yunnanensis]|uniref:Uncharacterized protein n=1 Tax=Nocardia yunnanensis TaxID=2382165 RepID=A0A386ZF00_9NOCA|nr:DUF6247 family protein [Nocardia yunnanensis]AYF76080.1 hypothetical protein D7D52_22080 [Nocardia yunnanensis]
MVPGADPAEIRAALTPTMRAEFDREWGIVLDRAKISKSLAGVMNMLGKWRYTVVHEHRAPGAYYRLLAKAELIERTGENPDARTLGEMQALIDRRLATRE